MRWAISRTTPWKRGLVSTSGGGEFRSSIYALRGRSHPFFPGALGALSAPAFSLHGNRNYPAGIWPEHSAVDRQSSWDHANGRPVVWTRPTLLFGSVVRLLGQPPLHDRRAVFASHSRLDTCLHRPLFLAPAKTVFQVGRAVPAGDSRAAAAFGHDRYPSRRPRGDRASVTTAMAQRTHQPYPARTARDNRRHHAVLFSDSVCVGDCAGVCSARRSRAA